MKKTNFSVKINAPKEKVWKVLWDNTTYNAWTSVFGEGSHVITDWKEGSEVLFLSGNGEGMFSTIARKIPNEFMSFKHHGIVKDKMKQPQNEETKDWTGATENYTLTDKDGETELIVELDVIDKLEEYFKNTFPEALEKIKELSEQQS
jgi:hypothetical protein